MSMAYAVVVARIAVGEISDTPPVPSGVASADARAITLTPKKRSEIASLAAKTKWHVKGRDMTQTANKEATVAHGREAVRMYPNNSLREPVRDYHNVVAEVVRSTFTK